MKQEETEMLRSMLLEQKSILLNRPQSFLDVGDCSSSGDEADMACNESDVGINLRLYERERLLVQKIDSALAKLERGTYGYCEECDEPLSFKRLLARPVATLCISCKEAQEASERSFA